MYKDAETSLRRSFFAFLLPEHSCGCPCFLHVQAQMGHRLHRMNKTALVSNGVILEEVAVVIQQEVASLPGLFSFIALFIKELTLLVSYVKNNAFPQPLTEKEESKYLQLMAEGDAHARNMLIEHNLRLVAHIVKKFDNTGEDLEDLISIGTIGLIKAIESFQPNKGTKLATFAARCIENEILMTIEVHIIKEEPNSGSFISNANCHLSYSILQPYHL